jgi:putative addiction module component (TIGR02574 family)
VSTSTAEKVDELRRLPTAEKLEVIGDLWDSIPADHSVVDSDTLDELERRCAEIDLNPARVIPWDPFLSTLRKM